MIYNNILCYTTAYYSMSYYVTKGPKPPLSAQPVRSGTFGRGVRLFVCFCCLLAFLLVWNCSWIVLGEIAVKSPYKESTQDGGSARVNNNNNSNNNNNNNEVIIVIVVIVVIVVMIVIIVIIILIIIVIVIIIMIIKYDSIHVESGWLGGSRSAPAPCGATAPSPPP